MRAKKIEPALLNGAFMFDRSAVVCTDHGALIFKPPKYDAIVSIPGSKFIHATALNGLIAAVAETDSPPYTPFFLLLYQQHSRAFIKSVEFPSRILGIVSTSIHLFVSIESAIQVFDVRSFRAITTVKRDSKDGLFAASQHYLAWTDDRSIGKVFVASTSDFVVKTQIQCHSSPIMILALDRDLPLLATASAKGTIIKINNIESKTPTCELRRGYTSARIVSISSDQGIKCVCSTTTIHVFGVNNNHITIPPVAPPICCTVHGNLVYVLMVNGMFNIYRIDDSVASIDQEFDLSNAQDKRRFRRQTT